jgi:hypothetical protein
MEKSIPETWKVFQKSRKIPETWKWHGGKYQQHRPAILIFPLTSFLTCEN